MTSTLTLLPVLRGLVASPARRRSTIGGICAAAVAVTVVVAGPGSTSEAATTPQVDAAYGTAGITSVTGDLQSTGVDGSGRALLATTDASGAGRLTRLTASGSTDTSFGTGGAVSLPFPGLLQTHADGSASVSATTESRRGIRVHRVNASGGTAASATVAANHTVEILVSVSGRPNGGLLVHGIDQNTSPRTHVLAAITAGGGLDTGWGDGGVLTLAEQDEDDVLAVAAAGDRVLTVTGRGVHRYTPSGALDTSFGTVALPANFETFSISVAGDAYLINGRQTGSAQRMAVVRVLAGGTRDTGFGVGGMATGAVHECTPTARRSFATSAGVYLIGHNGDCGASRVYVHRLTARGTSDTTFGVAGEVIVDQVGARRSMGGSGGAPQPDGKLVVTFRSDGGTTSAVRLLPAAVAVPAPYVAVRATRLLAPKEVAARKTVTVTVGGKAGVPASGVAAVAVDVRVERTRAAGGVIAYPTGGKVPSLTTHAHVTGQAVTQRITVPLGSAGRITLQNASSGAALLSATVAGYYRSGAYIPVAPARLLTAKNLGGGKTATVAVGGKAGVPAAGATRVLVNVSVSGVSKAGSLKLYPAGAPAPSAVIAAHAAKQPGSAGVSTALGAGGKLTVLNNAGAAGTVTVDVVGYLKN
ncbi:hypothetical protein AB0F72_38510 [Actinoplanes sp. NPDC023936]|uniref:hypothetical protein n=1 Tax=Actinoplanes sp. NPDC023936 TaxID=3154910 RepID=UPI003405A05D